MKLILISNENNFKMLNNFHEEEYPSVLSLCYKQDQVTGEINNSSNSEKEMSDNNITFHFYTARMH